MQISNVILRIKTFTLESRRVLAVTRKPTRTEFMTTVKVTAIGIIVVGLIGFVLQVANKLLL